MYVVIASGLLEKRTISYLFLYLQCLAERLEHGGLNKCWLSEWMGFWVGWMDGWMSEVLNFGSVENTLLTYANGIPSSACKTPEMTLPKCDIEFLFPTCIRESWSQKVRGEDWHFAAGNLQVRTQCLKLPE